MLTRKTIDDLFALTDEPGLKLDIGWGGIVARMRNRTTIDVGHEGDYLFVTFTPPIKLDSGIDLLAGATDGFLSRIRFEKDGNAVAYIEAKGPFGFGKVIAKPLGVTP